MWPYLTECNLIIVVWCICVHVQAWFDFSGIIWCPCIKYQFISTLGTWIWSFIHCRLCIWWHRLWIGVWYLEKYAFRKGKHFSGWGGFNSAVRFNSGVKGLIQPQHGFLELKRCEIQQHPSKRGFRTSRMWQCVDGCVYYEVLRAQWTFWNIRTVQPMKQHHFSEDPNPLQHQCVDHKSRSFRTNWCHSSYVGFLAHKLAVIFGGWQLENCGVI